MPRRNLIHHGNHTPSLKGAQDLASPVPPCTLDPTLASKKLCADAESKRGRAIRDVRGAPTEPDAVRYQPADTREQRVSADLTAESSILPRERDPEGIGTNGLLPQTWPFFPFSDPEASFTP